MKCTFNLVHLVSKDRFGVEIVSHCAVFHGKMGEMLMQMCAVCYLVYHTGDHVSNVTTCVIAIVHNLLLFQRNHLEKQQQQLCNATSNKGEMIPIKSVSFDQLFLSFFSVLCLASVIFLSWKNEMMKYRKIELKEKERTRGGNSYHHHIHSQCESQQTKEKRKKKQMENSCKYKTIRTIIEQAYCVVGTQHLHVQCVHVRCAVCAFSSIQSLVVIHE